MESDGFGRRSADGSDERGGWQARPTRTGQGIGRLLTNCLRVTAKGLGTFRAGRRAQSVVLTCAFLLGGTFAQTGAATPDGELRVTAPLASGRWVATKIRLPERLRLEISIEGRPAKGATRIDTGGWVHSPDLSWIAWWRTETRGGKTDVAVSAAGMTVEHSVQSAEAPPFRGWLRFYELPAGEYVVVTAVLSDEPFEGTSTVTAAHGEEIRSASGRGVHLTMLRDFSGPLMADTDTPLGAGVGAGADLVYPRDAKRQMYAVFKSDSMGSAPGLVRIEGPSGSNIFETYGPLGHRLSVYASPPGTYRFVMDGVVDVRATSPPLSVFTADVQLG